MSVPVQIWELHGTGSKLRCLPIMVFLFDVQMDRINRAVACKTVGMELRKSYEGFVRSKPPGELTELLELLEQLERLEAKSPIGKIPPVR